MMKKHVLVTTSSFGRAGSAPLDILREKCEVLLNPYARRLTTKEFIDLSDGKDGIIAGVEKITREALEQRRTIKVISRCGVGMDNIDLLACQDLGIQVFNTPSAPTDAVAELAIAMMLNLLRNISNMNENLKHGRWSKMPGFLLRGKKVGILGMGRIGTRVASILEGFGARIAYADVQDKHLGYRYLSKHDLLPWADIVTIHASGAGDGMHLLSQEELEMIRPSAFLINTARGNLVDESALCKALKQGKLAGAALDVFQEEPYEGELCALENVILTPHIASNAQESRVEMEMEAVRHLFDGLSIA